MRLLGVERLLDALRHDLVALESGAKDLPERHRSLRAALEWTISLLRSREKEVFTALSAFAMSWSLEEAEQLFEGEVDELLVWDATTRLMDASLVVVRGDGRFAMPQRVRQHAAELLVGSPSGERYRGRQAELVGLEARELALDMFVDCRRQLANIVDLLPEIRHALAWSRSRTPDAHRHLVGLVAPALAKTGELALVAGDITKGLPPGGEPRDHDEAAMCFAGGLVHAMQWSTDTDAEVGLFDRAARGFAAHGDPREEATAHYMAASALQVAGRPEDCRSRSDRLLEAASRSRDARWRPEVLRILAVDPQQSSQDIEQAVAQYGVGTGSFALQYADVRAQAACERGDLGAAAAW